MTNIHYLNFSKAGLVFDSRSGDSYQLNAAANRIITLFQAQKSPEETAAILSEEFQITPANALCDVLEFQVQLSLIGLAT